MMKTKGISTLAARLLAGACLAAAAHAPAWADTYPARGLSLVVPQAAGGSTDAISRLWAQYAAKKLGQPVVVENRPGAGGIIAVQYALRQPADGYTVLSAGISQMVLNKFTYKPLAYDPDKDLKGVGLLTTNPFLLVASKESGIRNLDDLIRLAKADPRALNFATAGLGNSTHVVVEMLQQQLGIEMTNVPFGGEAAGLTALLGGQVQVMAPVLSTGVPAALAGKVVPLLVLGDNRYAELPDVPSAADRGLTGFGGVGWLGLAVRSGTPPDVVTRLHAVTEEFLKDPDTVSRLKAMQVELMPGPADALDRKIAADTLQWSAVLKDINLSSK
ncbi:Bug family tripartite tricarboxylate transporter substrate binding protein [Achromobacter sp. NPDC058515]|uniref:Bug family tripartite tricarboxylate transporter substrate binding protein n=1 Tax=Achromobacter sp. NPDC058515 TaxID=3346533 RepID=UPI003647FA3F